MLLQKAAAESRALDVAEGRLELDRERLAMERDRHQLEEVEATGLVHVVAVQPMPLALDAVHEQVHVAVVVEVA